jgi:tetratricopeptide (TPR) repeat protein
MFELNDNVVASLSSRGYRPAMAAECLKDGRYSKAVEMCREHLSSEPESLSGRTIYARALYHAGQIRSATEQFYRVLSADPDNLVALKYLGDIKFSAGDEQGALADYRRVLAIDPYCQALCCPINVNRGETTRTITIHRPEEILTEAAAEHKRREIPFYTETMADLYLSQGYPRLAADVYRSLTAESQNPRLKEKLTIAEEKIKQKESSHVKKTD